MIELIQFPWSPFCIVQRRILEFSGVSFKIINIPVTDRSRVWKWTRERYYGVPIIRDGRNVVFEIAEESQVLQQEMILKAYITRSGLETPAIAIARIIPTDHIDVPTQEAVIPWQDLVAEAIAHRPEIEQNQIALENSRLELLGTRNALLPSLSVSASFANSGQAFIGKKLHENRVAPADIHQIDLRPISFHCSINQ